MKPAEFQTLRKKANIAQHGLGYTCWEGQLELFAKLVRNAALDEAAKVCSIKAEVMAVTGKPCDPDELAKAIRNLKEPTP